MRHRNLACLALAGLTAAVLAARPAGAISRDPNGVNVNSQGATTVFITFGGLANQVPVEAFWCGELVSAAPDRGSKCAPGTIFGRLPLRFDQSRLNGTTSFTDIMSIPPSVARRAYQAAASGATSSFFYVRRFVSTVDGPDEYVFVTCRMAGGGARVPFSLLDVRLRFAGDATVLSVARGAVPPALEAEIAYNGTGRLQGRWEVVLPGDEPPASRDLLTEATLPPEERPLQKRYTELSRFNLFLPPTGRVVLPGPDPARLPTTADGLYQVLLRVEASNDKEADSNLALAGAGTGIVHSGAVAGFPLPVLRYFVGSVPSRSAGGGVAPLSPAPGAAIFPDTPVEFAWSEHSGAALYRLEVAPTGSEEPVFAAVVQQGILSYRAPGFLASKAVDGKLRWRVVALSHDGGEAAASPWVELVVGPASPPVPPPGG
jgi:hypothetical protein